MQSVLFLIFVGCGLPEIDNTTIFKPFNESNTFNAAPFLGGVYTEATPNPECVKAKVQAAFQALAKTYETTDAATGKRNTHQPMDSSVRMPEVDLWITSGTRLGESNRIGEYYPKADGVGGVVVVTADMRALAHELLHHYEVVVLGTNHEDSINHLYWEERAWNMAASYYAANNKNPCPPM